jgi:hypothetical protein
LAVEQVIFALRHGLQLHDPAVVDKHIYSTELLLCQVKHTRNGHRITDIGLDCIGKPPFPLILVVSASAAPLTKLISTRKPSCANRSAIAAPIPRDAPVTMTIFFSALIFFSVTDQT